jgi:hypothetical protein
MGLTNWLEIYRGYTSDDLTAEMTSLRAGLRGGFLSQGSGSVQHSKDLTQLENRLQAATRVKNERSGGGETRVGQVDFSQVSSSDF